MLLAAAIDRDNKSAMYYILGNLVLVLLLLITGCSSDSAVDAAENSAPPTVASSQYNRRHPARVLRLDSYHASYSWSQEVAAGVEQGLAISGYSVAEGNLIIDQFYMDTKRNSDPDYFEQIAQETIAYIRQTDPDLVIVNDNNAIRLVVQPLLDEGIPFIYSGLNDDPATYGLTTSPYTTGVLERTYTEEIMNWIDRVFPTATRIMCIFDGSVTTQAYLPQIQTAIAESRFAGSPIYTTNSFDEWQTLVTSAPADSQVILIGLYQTLRDADGAPIEDVEVMKWTVENSSIPLVPLWEFSVQQGALGGTVISGEVQGYEAGVLAAEVLNGAAPHSLPVVTPRRGKLVINRQAMQQWDVNVPLDLLEISEVY